MKVSLKDVWAWIYNIPQGIGAYLKCRRIKRDIAEALAEWLRIGGFNASTSALLNFVSKFSVNLVEYATWTPIEWDDQIARMIRDTLIDHRDVIICILDWIRRGQEPSLQEFTAMAESVYVSSNDEYGSPMTVLHIITIIYHALMYLKLRTETNTVPVLDDDDTKPMVEPPPVPEPKRPVLNFIRKVFGKQ